MSSGFTELPDDTMLLINRLCNRFEQAWREDQQPDVESLLDGLDDAARLTALQELLPLEVEYRQLNNLPCDKDDYAARFPELDSEWLGTLFDTQPGVPSGTLSGHSPPRQLGDYEITDRLGAGGMGTVYKAVHKRMQRTVALKVLHPELSRNPDLVQRFEREVQAVARLSHPNIVAAHDARQDDDVHYLITEFVEGCDLERYVEQHGPLDVASAVDFLVQAARGLEYAHGQQVIHRDIKPANLFLSAGDDRQIKILDMGLARLNADVSPNEAAASGLTKSGMVIGTAAYMAPEQARDARNADERSDVYSLGCTLYYLLTGRPAFGGETVVDTILAHVNHPIPSLSAGNNATPIPEELDVIFRRMVAKDADERYQTMAEVIAELEGFASNASVSPEGDTPPQRRLSIWPHGVLAGLLLALALLAVMGFLAADGDEAVALSFNGRSSYVAVPSLEPDSAKPITLEAIVQVRTARTSNVISWLGPDWTALFITEGGHWGIGRRVGSDSVLIQSTVAGQPRQPVHLAGTWNGRELQLFVDGEQAETHTVGFDLPVATGGLFIGGVRRGLLPQEQSDRFFDGLIYEVRISEGVRYSQSFNAPQNLQSDASTLALYHFNAGNGERMSDASGHGHQATIVDANWVGSPQP